MSHLTHAETLVTALESVVATAATSLAGRAEKDGRISTALLDEHQTVAYDLASVASAVAAARHLLGYGEKGDHEASLALAYAADVAVDLQGRVAGRASQWGLDGDALADVGEAVAGGGGRPGGLGGVDGDALADVGEAVAAGRDPQFLSDLADKVLATGEAGPRHLSEELEMVRQTFRRFAEDKVVPVAEEVHRHDQDIPENVISGLAELGCFALSIPEEYGGFSAGGEDELLNMVLVTEELSRGSLGVAGSLITRPEIIGTAILKGGTDQQKQTWLPAIASGEKMCGVAVTEPDYGSDVAGVKVSATRDGDDWVINGVKTWCTFGGRAEYLLVLARTDPDRSLGHKGLSLFVVEKPSFEGHEWKAEQESGGSMDARAIPTIGYRGMHSFEISFDSWRVPHANLIGEDDGLGRGFYLQMQAFANARLQTAARALGVMQSALEHATGYAKQRHVFDAPLADYELNRTKIARMAALIAACRVFATDVARQLARGDDDAALAASQVKQLSCRVSEWVTREAQQIHGGYGYAEEYTVSRLFVDARVLSIFEGADEVLALRVIAKTLLGNALAA